MNLWLRAVEFPTTRNWSLKFFFFYVEWSSLYLGHFCFRTGRLVWEVGRGWVNTHRIFGGTRPRRGRVVCWELYQMTFWIDWFDRDLLRLIEDNRGDSYPINRFWGWFPLRVRSISLCDKGFFQLITVFSSPWCMSIRYPWRFMEFMITR